MKMYTDEMKREEFAIEIVAVRATYFIGAGTNSANYDALTAGGEWRTLRKKWNPHIKIAIKRPSEVQWRFEGKQSGRYIAWTSQPVSIDSAA
jgi:hypothetical protein